jgi:hypothetical protein
VHLPASCDSAIRRLCFGFDIWLREINVRDKESFMQFFGGIQQLASSLRINVVLWKRSLDVCALSGLCVCALGSMQWPD